jgi:uncharacterized cupin superfamily protein
MNEYQFKAVKLKGDFVWHDHKHTDETFIVIDGVLRIDFRDGSVLVIERRGVLNTSQEGGDRTAQNDVWV